MSRWFKTRAKTEADDQWFAISADRALAQQAPHGAQWLIWLVFVVVVVLLFWAWQAELDVVTRGEGKVIPSRQVQVLQSLDGGIVSEILVREGQVVKSGDVLLRVDPTRSESSFNENKTQSAALRAKAARLRALADGGRFSPSAGVLREAPEVVEQERQLFESRRNELDAMLGVAKQQLSQRNQELNSVKARREQATRSYELTNRELELTRPLVRSGAVSDVDVLRLERDVARFKGERDSANTDIPRLEAAIAETTRRIQEIELTFRNAARTELSETNARIAALTQGGLALADRVRQTEIKSPVNGTIKQLKVNTVGGVVQPGRDLIEVVPSDDALLLEARVVPRDIAFLRPGQPSIVKFSAYDFATFGGLDARLEHISADTVTDEKGNAYYLVRVRTNKTTIGKDQLPIIPGMIAQVDILTGKRTVLDYLLKPILRAKANALSER